MTIPVHNESGLERCLDSLFLSATHAGNLGPKADADQNKGIQTEVLILINAAAEAPQEVLEQNQATLASARSWIAAHPHPSISFHAWLDHSFGKKEAGVGLARKILMDEAIRRFSFLDNPQGIIASLDADVTVDANYLGALVSHFESSDADGCSIYFEHPLGPGESGSENSSEAYPQAPETFSPMVYEAIAQYELHLRYYLQSVRSTGFPNAFHTVGSSFAVRAGVYCLEGGMNKRQGGEDFYFIQKVAQRGNWSECNTTRVCASPRPSDRVPFGTGPVVSRLSGSQLSGNPESLTTYHPEPFRILTVLFRSIDELYQEKSTMTLYASLPGVLADFLATQQFIESLAEIRKNSGSPEAFRKRFWRWFNMFRIMKFLHYARENGYPDIPILKASSQMPNQIPQNEKILPDNQSSLIEILHFFRGVDRYLS